MSNVFFTSDLHFGHANIIKYTNRPFPSVEEMDETLIRNWNKTVEPSDTIYHLGDFALAPDSRIEHLLVTLKGNIHIIFGNHDKGLKRVLRHSLRLVAWAGDYKEIKIDEQFIVLSHYAFRVWNRSHHGSWNLFGHSHGNLPDLDNLQIDVGVDAVSKYGLKPYTPVSFEEVAKIMKNRKFAPTDGHGGGI